MDPHLKYMPQQDEQVEQPRGAVSVSAVVPVVYNSSVPLSSVPLSSSEPIMIPSLEKPVASDAWRDPIWAVVFILHVIAIIVVAGPFVWFSIVFV